MTNSSINVRQAIRLGFIAGIVSLCVSAIGMAELFGKRQLISELLTLGQVIVFLPTVLFAYSLLRNQETQERLRAMVEGLILGIVSAVPLVFLVLVASAVNIREFFPNVSPASIDLLTFDLAPTTGSLVLVLVLGFLGALTAYIITLPEKVKTPITKAVLVVLIVGLFSELLADRARDLISLGFSRILFKGKALQVVFAIIVFLATISLEVFMSPRRESRAARRTARSEAQNKRFRIGQIAVGAVLLLVTPLFLGDRLEP